MALTLDEARQKAADYALLMAAQSVLKQNPLGEYFAALVRRDLGLEENGVLPSPTAELPLALVPPPSAPAALPPAPNGAESRGNTRQHAEPERGSSGAIFEARNYVLSCLEKETAISVRVVENLTGMLQTEVTKFITGVDQEWKASRRAQAEKKAASLIPTPLPPKPVAEERTEPMWWTVDKQRYCATCSGPIPPRKIGRYFVPEHAYQTQKFCKKACVRSKQKTN